jgi:uncharacterized protein YbjT (DUF2867 family)
MSVKKIVAVFGSTGLQGGSVVTALLKNGNYHVKAITRSAKSDKAIALAALNNCSVEEADLDDKSSIEKVLKGVYGCFFVTDFSAHIKKTEVTQGVNVIDSSIKNGVKHVVFSGLENVESVLHKPCFHFDYKAEIENYGLKHQDKINFSSVRLAAYFENFESSFLHRHKDKEYFVNIPMEGKQMIGVSVGDIGEAVLTVFENPQEYKSKLLGLAGDKLLVSEYIAILNKHLAPINFIDSHITAQKFGSLGFPAAEELSVMFEFFQSGKMQRDLEFSKKLNKNVLTFEAWVVKNKTKLLASL